MTTKTEVTATTFAELKTGDCFMFVRDPHPLGWPDGPWEKTGYDTVYHTAIGIEAMMDSIEAQVRIVQAVRWTVERVKRELPPVKVKYTESDTVYTGEVQGRNREFAMVFWDGGRAAEWAWEAIANCLNEGRPLLA